MTPIMLTSVEILVSCKTGLLQVLKVPKVRNIGITTTELRVKIVRKTTKLWMNVNNLAFAEGTNSVSWCFFHSAEKVDRWLSG